MEKSHYKHKVYDKFYSLIWAQQGYFCFLRLRLQKNYDAARSHIFLELNELQLGAT